MVIYKIQKTDEEDLSRNVTRTVVAVLTYFNDTQRAATKDAGIIAGLDVLRIIKDPTSAVLAYGLDKIKEENEKNILVLNLGGVCNILLVLSGSGRV